MLPIAWGNFNTVTDEGRRWLTRALEFCAERWARPDRKFGRVAGYIIGNEVNSHWWWANMGRVRMEEFADDYLRTVRHGAHGHPPASQLAARLCLARTSLEHPQSRRRRAAILSGAGVPRLLCPSKPAEGGDFDWNVAFHPYPEDLFEPRFWNDKSATTNVLTTPRITFKNIELLPAYLRRPELLSTKGHPRRIILSEQGFHTPQGCGWRNHSSRGVLLRLQEDRAARRHWTRSSCTATWIMRDEGGLLLGLRSNQPKGATARPKKKIYDCFRLADTPEWEQEFAFSLPVIGLTNWNQVQR
jgi:hypothetical protein